MNLAAALRIVAASAINDTCDDWIEDGWEQMPDIGEVDFGRVVLTMIALGPARPSASEHDAAMKFLMDRVDNSEM